MMTSESASLARISAYVAENKRKSALEAEKLQNRAVEVKTKNHEGKLGQTTTSESRRLDCIYDNETLGFENDPLNSL